MQNIVIIPAREGSKGVKKKNLAIVNDRPLIYWTLMSIMHLTSWRIFVSTDSQDIQNYVQSLGFSTPFLRPKSLATDTSSTLSVIVDTVEKCENLFNEKYEIIMTLQPTSPLRNKSHINEALQKFADSKNADSLVSCQVLPHIFNPGALLKLSRDGYLTPLSITEATQNRRQEKPQYLVRNGAAIYITKKNNLKEGLYSGNCIPYLMNKIDSLDVDDHDDLYIADALLRIRHN